MAVLPHTSTRVESTVDTLLLATDAGAVVVRAELDDDAAWVATLALLPGAPLPHLPATLSQHLLRDLAVSLALAAVIEADIFGQGFAVHAALAFWVLFRFPTARSLQHLNVLLLASFVTLAQFPEAVCLGQCLAGIRLPVF